MSTVLRFIASAGGTFLLPAVLTLLIIWELATPMKLSAVANLYETLGYGHAKAIEIRTEAEAKYEHEMRLAVAEVERVSNAYNGLWQTYNNAIGATVGWEGQLLKQQVDTIRGSQWVPQIMTNLAAFGCVLNGLAEDPADKAALNGACIQSEVWREDMVAQYADLIPQHRTNMTQEMIESFPPPAEILSPEFQRVAAKYRSE